MSKAKIEKAPALNLPHDFELIAPFVLSEQYGMALQTKKGVIFIGRSLNGVYHANRQ